MLVVGQALVGDGERGLKGTPIVCRRGMKEPFCSDEEKHSL